MLHDLVLALECKSVGLTTSMKINLLPQAIPVVGLAAEINGGRIMLHFAESIS